MLQFESLLARWKLILGTAATVIGAIAGGALYLSSLAKASTVSDMGRQMLVMQQVERELSSALQRLETHEENRIASHDGELRWIYSRFEDMAVHVTKIEAQLGEVARVTGARRIR